MKSVYKNGKIYTINKAMPWASVMVVEDGDISYIGDEPVVGDEVVDLGGRMVMPSFIDSHTHLGYIASGVFHIKMPLFETVEEILTFVGEYAGKHPKEEVPFLYFDYYMAEIFGDTEPSKELLDSVVNDRPCLLQDFSEHACIVNSKMLELLGIDKNVPNRNDINIYVRDEEGNPTGWIKEAAWWEDQETMYEKLGWNPDQFLEPEHMESFYGKMNAYGISGAFNAFITEEKELASTYALDKAGKLNFYFDASYRQDGLEGLDDAIATIKELQKKYTSERVKINTLKTFIDGTMAQGSAGLLEPLSNDPEGKNCGNCLYNAEELVEYFTKANDAGLDVHIHTVGDRSFRNICDAVEVMREKEGENWKCMVTIAHCGIVHPDDAGRPGKLGITLNLTPHWMGGMFGDDAIEYIGYDRWLNQGMSRDLIASGATVALSSDTVTNFEFNRSYPFFGIEIANTRVDIEYPLDPAKYPGSIMPPAEEFLPLDVLLEGYTLGSAKQMRIDDITGSLEVGKRANFIVLSDNCFEVPADKIHEIKIDMHVFEGKVIETC